MPKIEEFLDYREYLHAFYKERKERKGYFSYRLLGRLVGMDASLLAKVLQKERHIADESIPAFVSALKLNAREGEYFENLVHFGKARSDAQAKVYFERMMKLQRVPSRRLEGRHFAYFSSWRHAAIRALLEFYEFRGDYKTLAAQLNPPVTPKEARESVKLLKELDLVKDDGTGRLVPSDKAITTGERWASVAVASFQKETIALAGEALERHPRENRDVSTITMSVSREDIAEIKERIAEFRSSIVKFVNESANPEVVCHLNLQLIPLSVFPKEARP